MSDTTVIIDGLLRRLREGNEEARRELLGRAYRRLEILARGRVRSFPGVGETGDVLHDVMIELDRVLQAVEPDSPRRFFALASQHIRWTLLDLAKRRRFTDELPDTSDTADGPATVAQTADLQARLHAEVERLPTELREVTDLLHYQGLNVVEAAEVLQVSDRTVKKRWRDARLALFDRLGEPGVLGSGGESA